MWYCGTVFELTPDGQGGWTYNEIYSAIGGVAIAIDSQGNLYVSVDIASGDIFELSPVAGGTWVVSHVYGFTGTYDGSDPMAPVIVDANGDVYGTTLNGAYGCGAVFELIPFGNQWLEQTLHIFTCGGGAPGPDGAYPEGSLIMDRAGNLYGTLRMAGPEMDRAWCSSCTSRPMAGRKRFCTTFRVVRMMALTLKAT